MCQKLPPKRPKALHSATLPYLEMLNLWSTRSSGAPPSSGFIFLLLLLLFSLKELICWHFCRVFSVVVHMDCGQFLSFVFFFFTVLK